MGLSRLGSVLYLSWFIPVTQRDLGSECESKEISASVLCICMEWGFTPPGGGERGPSQHVSVTGATCSIPFILFRKCEPDVLWPCKTRTLHQEEIFAFCLYLLLTPASLPLTPPRALLHGIQRKKKAEKLIRNLEEGNLPFCCISDNDRD